MKLLELVENFDMNNTERFQIRYICNDYCYIRNNVPLSEIEKIINNDEISSLIIKNNYGEVVYKGSKGRSWL